MNKQSNWAWGVGRVAWAGIGIVAMLFSTQSIAQEKACVTLKTEAQIEESYTDAQGKPAKRLVPPGRVVPGDEIVWTIVATNTCAKAAEKVVIDNAVPEHMSYLADSAMGVGTDIAFSLNGRDYAKLSDLKLTEAGVARAPRADEIKSIRWTYGSAFAANATGFVRYRAKVR